MSSITRLKNKNLNNLGFDDWGSRDIIPNDMDDETVETKQEFPDNGIGGGKIESLSVTKLKAGSLLVDSYIQSTGFVSGTTGWQIKGDGTAEFVGITLSGGTLKYGKTSFADSTNAGYILNSSGVYFGSASDAKYLKYTIGTGALALKGDITITGGSGIASLSDAGDLATKDTADFATDVSGATKPENNATVGANWNTNLINIPGTLSTPSGAGLYLSSTNLGYYSGSVWKTYMDSSGNFYLGGTSGKLQWNAGTDTGTISGWTIGATTLANGTNIILDASNKEISINDSTFGNDGIQLQYNSGNPRAYIGDGANQYFKHDGTNISFKGTNAELTTAGVLTVANILVTGGTIQNDATVVPLAQKNTAYNTFIGNYNDGLTQAVAGTSTITRSLLNTRLGGNGEATLSSVVFKYDGGGYDTNTWSSDMEFFIIASVLGGAGTTDSDTFVGFRDVVAISHDYTDTARHIGFFISDAKVYASNANGTNQTVTELTTLGTLADGETHNYHFIQDTGTNIKFYVDNVLLATHTTNLPTTNTGGGPKILIGIHAPTGARNELRVNNNYVAIYG